MNIIKKILVVDDEPKLLEVSASLLESEGYQISLAESGNAAIAALSAEYFDLVLLDLNMPEVTGLDVMAYINDSNIKINVIVLSGEITFEWVSRAFQLGAFDYIQKPYEFDALLNSIKNALHKLELESGVSRLSKQLEKSEKLHRFMIESSPDIIFIVGSDGRFSFANSRAEELLGFRKNELIGKHFSTVVDPEYLEIAEYCFLERREGDRADKDAELWLRCKPGSLPSHGKAKIAIELNSLGVYDQEGGDKGSSDGNRNIGKFSGTYIVARDITERLASEKLIHYQAYHDLLTGLPNRALFLDRIGNAISNCRRAEDKLAVMFLDLDRFKVVNDTLGHSVGDALLQQAAKRLTLALRRGDSLARLGGDEFTVLLPHVESEQVAQKVAQKIVDSFKDAFVVEGHEIYISASIGLSLYPRDGKNAEVLIKNSDIAMYHTKDQGKNGYHLYEYEMSEKHQRTLNLENDIRRGLKENQFEVYYQPQVSADSGEVVGMEALLRWNHPQKGLLSPGYFLPIAEETGLIVELGDWVINAALVDMKQWREAEVDVGKLAINFSSKQIEQKDFVDKIICSLDQYGFPCKSLEIEITESTLIGDLENTVSKLKQLHNVGIHVAIDDFGTGYSSLSLLQKLPIKCLKIDRSFIQEMNEDSDRSIIEAIIQMAKGLKLNMVAEGVEEEYQLSYLRELNCPVIQGYIYSRGVPADDAKKIIQDASFVIDRTKMESLAQGIPAS